MKHPDRQAALDKAAVKESPKHRKPAGKKPFKLEVTIHFQEPVLKRKKFKRIHRYETARARDEAMRNFSSKAAWPYSRYTAKVID